MPLFQEAKRGSEVYRHASPLIGYIIDEIRAREAVAKARLGNIQEARSLFRLSLPRIKAVEADDLMNEYLAADRSFQAESSRSAIGRRPLRRLR